MTVIELSDLSWKELRTEARLQGIKSHGVKRPELEKLLMGAGINTLPTETLEEQVTRLTAELADKKEAQVGPHGPNYWMMSHPELKALMQSCEGYDPLMDNGSQASMISQLQAADFKRGLKPCPKDQPVSIVGKRSIVTSLQENRMNSLKCPVKDVIFLEDQDGNKVFTVHRIGSRTAEGPVVMDMEEHSQRVMNLFNQGETK